VLAEKAQHTAIFLKKVAVDNNIARLGGTAF